MEIWIINQYNMPPEYGHLNRHYNMGKYLRKNNHIPTVFVGSFLHNTSIQMIKEKSIFKEYKNCEFSYYFLKTCDYSQSNIKRFCAMMQFYRNMLKTAQTMKKPDVVIGSSGHPLSALAAINLSKRYKCQGIVEIRDLWPESFVAYGIIDKKNPLLRLLYAGEKYVYKKADKLIFTMEGGKDYIIEKGWNKENDGPIDLRKVFHINNGVDLEVFNYNKINYAFSDEDLDNLNTFKVIYTGSIRKVNNVKKIINAAYIIKKYKIDDVVFILYGDGDELKRLKRHCKDKNITNVIFKGYIDKKKVPYVLSKSDLNVFHFDQNNIKRYGSSMNKLFDYFASGKPIISDCKFGYDLIVKYKAGIVIDDANASELAKGIIEVKNMKSTEYIELCKNSIEAAKVYDYKNLVSQLEKIIYEGP